MSTKTELGVWGFEHFVLYLCAIVERLHPTHPAGQLEQILVAARTAVQLHQPVSLQHLRITDPPSDLERWQSIEEIAGAIIDIVQYWFDQAENDRIDQTKKQREKRQRQQWHCYEDARDAARFSENTALKHLDQRDLVDCAISAFALQPNDDSRDAAAAAMWVGHYDVALDILTREDD